MRRADPTAAGMAVLFLLTAVAPRAGAGVIRNDLDPSLYTTLAADPRYAATGALFFSTADSDFLGSAVLIDPSWVLTAAHCVDGNDNHGGGLTSVSFALGPDGLNPDEQVSADAWFPHPDWVRAADNSITDQPDIALVHLSTPITDVTPAQRYRGIDSAGSVVTIVGYGGTGTGLTGETTLDVLKRAGTNQVTSLGGAYAFWRFAEQFMLIRFDSPSTTSALPMEMAPGHGDSGGGWYIEEDGQTWLAGLTSYGTGTRYQAVDTGIRVSLYNDWIDQTMAAYVPEPSTALFAGLPALLALRRRRRSVA